MASGIIQLTLLLLAMGLALLPFFQFFRGTPHQLAAIKQLEESMPPELLEEHEADWFQAWKESGYDQQVFMPYFKQLDNETGTGYRECFSSAAAMVAAYYKKVRTDDEYNKIRAKYGDTTSVEAQLAALRSLGLEAEFRKDGDADMVELEIEAGRPVLVGWLHAGNMLRGEPPMCNGLGCGHWSVISGYAGKNSNDPEWIMQDPRGYPEMEKGGHSNPHLGRNVRVRQAAFYKKVRTDDEYNKIRAKYGDTTSVEAQIAALESLGLKAEFRKDGDADMVELEIEAGRPVLVGWLHAGNMLRGEPPMCNGLGCGHWSVISGYAGKNSNDPEWIMQDPRGYPEMEKGGHSNPHLGRNVRVRQAAFYQRWQAEGPGTGWVILVNE